MYMFGAEYDRVKKCAIEGIDCVQGEKCERSTFVPGKMDFNILMHDALVNTLNAVGKCWVPRGYELAYMLQSKALCRQAFKFIGMCIEETSTRNVITNELFLIPNAVTTLIVHLREKAKQLGMKSIDKARQVGLDVTLNYNILVKGNWKYVDADYAYDNNFHAIRNDALASLYPRDETGRIYVWGSVENVKRYISAMEQIERKVGKNGTEWR